MEASDMNEIDDKIYFCVSDIHGFAAELKSTLWAAGFRKTNKNHILIICGDVFDRGSEAVEVYKYLKSINKDRLILIKGNHEQLYLELLAKRYPSYHDFTNGTVSTFCQIANMLKVPGSDIPMLNYLYYDVDDDTDKYWNIIRNKVAKSDITTWLKSDSWKNYYEVGKFIFVHGFIPVMKDDWRKYATESDWESSTWCCPWKQYLYGYFNEESANGKILVCGHWHTGDFFSNLINDQSNHDDIFYLDNIIAIDGGVKSVYGKLAHKQNVLIIDKDKIYDGKLARELKMAQKTQPKKETSYWVDPKCDISELCLCTADCKKSCARKRKEIGYATYADFSNTCGDFELEEAKNDSN